MIYTKFIPAAEKIFPWIIYRIPVDEKLIFLTFDDGPDAETTPRILRHLEKFNAKATFFVKGLQIPMVPGMLVQIIKAGHALGNHGFSHVSLWTRKKSFIVEEIQKTNQLIEKACGITTYLFRPPYGKFRPVLKKILEDYGMRAVLWNVDSRDYVKSESPQSIIRNVLLSAKPGSIILLHDSTKNGLNSLQALPTILNNFSERGFHFASLEDYLPKPDNKGLPK